MGTKVRNNCRDPRTSEPLPLNEYFGPSPYHLEPDEESVWPDEVAQAMKAAGVPIIIEGGTSAVPARRTMIVRSRTYTKKNPLQMTWDSRPYHFYDGCQITEDSDVLAVFIERLARRDDIDLVDWHERDNAQPAAVENTPEPPVAPGVKRWQAVRRRCEQDLHIKVEGHPKMEQLILLAWDKNEKYTRAMLDDLGIRFAVDDKGKVNLNPEAEDGNVSLAAFA